MKLWLLPLIPADNNKGFERHQVGHVQEALDRIANTSGASLELSLYDEESQSYCSVFFANGKFKAVTTKDVEKLKAERSKYEEAAKTAV